MSKKEKGTFLCFYCGERHPIDLDTCPEEMEALTAVDKLSSEVLEGKYQALRVIGKGGMGVVYEGNHLKTGRKVALKFLDPALRKKSGEAYDRFKREARAAAAIHHKNIVQVYDMGENESGIPYIVMEHLVGEDLYSRIAAMGRLSLDEACKILSQVLEGLVAVHSCGVVHRDLKPANIFYSKQSGGDWIVKVLDFGISRLTKGVDPQNLNITRAGVVFGTPSYISKEQAEGAPDIDHRADLYAAGMLLYEMATGHLPFNGGGYAGVLVDIIMKPIPDPRTFLPDMPGSMVDFLKTSLEKERENRFQSAQEMLRELKSLDIAPRHHLSQPPGGKAAVAFAPGKPVTPVREIAACTYRDHSTPPQKHAASLRTLTPTTDKISFETGKISSFSFQSPAVEIIVCLHLRGLTGTLIMKDIEALVYRVFFAGGAPSLVSGERLSHYLGEIFVDVGLLDRSGLQHCVEAARSGNIALGQYLLDSGIVDSRQLDTAIRIQTRMRMKYLFRIFEGDFVFYQDENITGLDSDRMVPTSLPSILPASLRSTWSGDRLKNKLEDIRGLTFSIMNYKANLQLFRWNTDETAALKFLDGKKWAIDDNEILAYEKLNPSTSVVLYTLFLMEQLQTEGNHSDPRL